MRHTAAVLAVLISTSIVLAGPITPPAGTVAPTYKTLTEVEPRIAVNATNTPGDSTQKFIINQPGSYYLTGNVTVSGISAIRISAPDVTLDLAGFQIVDELANNIGADRWGVVSNSTFANVSVVNGTIRGFSSGVLLNGARARVEGVRAESAEFTGIGVAANALVTDCSAFACATGIQFNASTVVRNCHVSANTGTGFQGLGVSAQLIDCTSRSNGGPGASLAANAIVRGCTFSINGGEGLTTAAGANVTNCISSSNSGSGFAGTDSCTYIACTGLGNNAYGIEVGNSALVQDCAVSGSATSAVRCATGCRIVGNRLDGVSGFPVVLIGGNDVHVERNTINGGTNAVSVSAGVDALIISNTCRGQSGTVFNLVLANHQVGPSVTATGTIASTSPFANFVR